VTQQEGGIREPSPSVLVVGGGLVGLSCAFYLHRGGARVTVLERQKVGSGASRGNAGLVCPAMTEPLPGPGVMRNAVAGLFRPDSPLYVHPTWAPRMAAFLLRFARHSTRRAFERGLDAMAPLSRTVFECYDDLAACGIEVGGGRDGYVIACASIESARRNHDQLVHMSELGIGSAPGPLLTGPELTEFEPSLAGGTATCFLLPDERWVDPSRVVDGLAAWLRGAGVQIIEEAGVRDVEASGQRVAIETAGRRFEADLGLVAGGIGSQMLCRRLGVSLGMQPGKGYSFSVFPESMPRRALHLPDGHVAVTPMNDRLRIAGTMEFDGTFDRFEPRRVQAMVAAARPYFSGIDWNRRSDEWVGPRPMTPDGLPMIGRVAGQSRMFVATGHNMLGVTLAPATGRVIADLMLRAEAPFDLSPFSPNRFR
jgi:D-amino-acid dehydrogenase